MGTRDAPADESFAPLRSAIRNALAVDTSDPAQRLPEATRALVLAQGDRAIPILLEIIADAILEPNPHHGPKRYVPGNAATLLADLHVKEAIEPLLTLVEVVHPDDLECASDATWALGRFGRDVLEPALARHAVASDQDVQDRLAGVLAWSRVRDDRIFEALVRVFEWDDELAASLLLEYGDPRAIPYFVALLDAPAINPELVDILDEAAQAWDLPNRDRICRNSPRRPPESTSGSWRS